MKVLIADDHQLFREGLIAILACLGGSPTIVEANDFSEAIIAAECETGIDIVLLDLTMPGGPWPQRLAQLRQLLPQPGRIVIVSAASDYVSVGQAMTLGASGFIPKTASSRIFLSAIDLVLAGGAYLPPGILEQKTPSEPYLSPSMGINVLTPRQREVLEQLKHGKSNKEIAKGLDLAEGTVKLHVTAILKSLDLKSRTQAALTMVQFEQPPSSDSVRGGCLPAYSNPAEGQDHVGSRERASRQGHSRGRRLAPPGIRR
jgi:DNA-binding NarL/FixJ family response regulator